MVCAAGAAPSGSMLVAADAVSAWTEPGGTPAEDPVSCAPTWLSTHGVKPLLATRGSLGGLPADDVLSALARHCHAAASAVGAATAEAPPAVAHSAASSTNRDLRPGRLPVPI
jgi:hypothetical protein